jgi:hypothetical protein
MHVIHIDIRCSMAGAGLVSRFPSPPRSARARAMNVMRFNAARNALSGGTRSFCFQLCTLPAGNLCLAAAARRLVARLRVYFTCYISSRFGRRDSAHVTTRRGASLEPRPRRFERFSVVRVRSEHGQGDCLPATAVPPARFVKNFSATSSTVIVYLT